VNKKILYIGSITLVIGIVAIGGLVYSFLKAPEAASAPIEAIPISKEAEILSSNNTDESQGNESKKIFLIVQEESEARFLIDEVLRGAPKTVVGTTDQVSGQIQIDVNDPASAQIGTILINARTLTTDNDFRNRAIKNRILETDNYEFITFNPTTLNSLPDQINVGETYIIETVGDLTIKDVTKEVTFITTITIVSESKLQGFAQATILFSDFGIIIPDAPAVSSVADEVILEIESLAEL
jgi:polyisoprenoid-binding protein YceI